MSSFKSHFDRGEYLVAYSLACTFENDNVCAKGFGSICFGSLNEVIDEDDLECLNEGKTEDQEVMKIARLVEQEWLG